MYLCMDVYRVEDKIKAIHCNRCQGIGQMREKVFQSAKFFDGSPLQVRQAEIALFIWCRIPKWLQNQFVFQDVFDENIQRNLAERYMGKCVAAQQMPLILPGFSVCPDGDCPDVPRKHTVRRRSRRPVFCFFPNGRVSGQWLLLCHLRSPRGNEGQVVYRDRYFFAIHQPM